MSFSGYDLGDPKHPDRAGSAAGLRDLVRPIDELAHRNTPAWPYDKCLVCLHDVDEHADGKCHVPGCTCGARP